VDSGCVPAVETFNLLEFGAMCVSLLTAWGIASRKKVRKLGSGDFIACFSMQILENVLGNGHRCELNKVIIKVA